MADIFISYARADRPWVKTLVDALEAEGWSVWWDLHLRSGEAFDEAIERTIRQVRCVITVWSTHSVQSKWVRAETAWARDHDKLVCVRRDDGCEIPLQFYLTHADSLAGWDGTRSSSLLRKVVDDVAALVGRPAGSAALPKPLSVFRDRLAGGQEGPEMVVIPAGSFLMGSPENEPERYADEGPVHTVSFALPFAMGKYAVTFEEYDRFTEATAREKPGDEGWGRGRRPVIDVSWHDATAYAEWLSRETGKAYRLPTEAEWEYAARAGTQTPFWTGACIDTDQANYDGNYDYANCGAKTGVSRGQTVPVGSLPANRWGLHEVAGNVWEWTCSEYEEVYNGAEQNCASNNSASYRVLRGGSWDNDPRYVRSADRYGRPAAYRLYFVGFRLARSI